MLQCAIMITTILKNVSFVLLKIKRNISLVVCDFFESSLHIKLNVVPFCKCVDISSVAIAISPRKGPKSESKILSQPGIQPGTSC